MIDKLKENIIVIVKRLYNIELADLVFEHPNSQNFGDLSTNVALELAPKVKQSPMEIAKNIVYELEKIPILFEIDKKKYNFLESINIASPGFINIEFNEKWLKNLLVNTITSANSYGSGNKFSGQKVILEYTDPNPFKIFHIGHLMTNTIGESLARIYAFSGAQVKRANYQGDVGIHVAKSLWGLLEILEKENKQINEIEKLPLEDRITFLGKCYAHGNKCYDEDPVSTDEIKSLNSLIFAIAQDILLEEDKNRKKSVDFHGKILPSAKKYDYDKVKNFYYLGRKWSLEYFETLYKVLGTKFDYYYLESMVGELGYTLTIDNIKSGIFERNDGAVIFKGEKYGLHTRVFVNSNDLPLYEAKDLGLAFLKYQDFKYDKSIIITANEINDYFKVVLKAMSMIDKDLSYKTVHIGHGMMKFKDGKMSSRLGNAPSGEQLLNSIKEKVQQKMIESNKSQNLNNKDELSEKIAVGSLKYAILKSSIGNDIIYDEDEAVSLHGNSGSYLMYTYARINSLLEKNGIDFTEKPINYDFLDSTLNTNEKDILRHIYKFPEEVERACDRLSPNLVAGFLYELAQRYNKFYAEDSILDCEDEMTKTTRLYLSMGVMQVIKNGLNLLGIEVVSKM